MRDSWLVIDQEQSAAPDIHLLGGAASEIVRLARVGFAIVPTMILTASAFFKYQRKRAMDGELVAAVRSFMEECGAVDVLVWPSSPYEIEGLPQPVQVRGIGAVEFAVERCYRRWFEDECFAFRTALELADVDPAVAVLVQVVNANCIEVLNTRDPGTGARFAVRDRYHGQANGVYERESLLRALEESRKAPTEVTFQENYGRLQVIGVRSIRLSDISHLRALRDLYKADVLTRVEVLCQMSSDMFVTAAAAVVKAAIPDRSDSATFGGLAASRGVGVGRIVFPGRVYRPEDLRGPCVFACEEFDSTDDRARKLLARCCAAFSTRGGLTSHLAVHARVNEIPAVVRVEGLSINLGQSDLLIGKRRRTQFGAAVVDGERGAVVLYPSLPIHSFPASTTEGSNVPVLLVNWVSSLLPEVWNDVEFSSLGERQRRYIERLHARVRAFQAQHD